MGRVASLTRLQKHKLLFGLSLARPKMPNSRPHGWLIAPSFSGFLSFVWVNNNQATMAIYSSQATHLQTFRHKIQAKVQVLSMPKISTHS